MSKFKALFGGGAKPAGPDPELIKAQKKQQERLDKQEAEQESAKAARENSLAAQQGRSGFSTLFAKSGEQGVKQTLGSKA